MIAATLYGGLGNQMFVYAMSRAMSLRNNVPMAFNIKSGFERDLVYRRKLELDKFKLLLPTSPLITFDFWLGHFFERLSCKFGRNLLMPQYKYIKESFKDFHYESEILKKTFKNVYLEGYWQNPDYFEDFAETIRNDFELNVILPDSVIAEMRYLQSFHRPLVMVGVRLYQEAIGQPTRLKVCGVDYYNKAMEYIVTKLKNPLFVVFCQDQKWVKENLADKYDSYVVKEKKGSLSAVSDLFIMRSCNHAIISNSTYYWWGAWLQSTNKTEHIVVCSNNFINPSTPCREWKIIDA